MKNGGSDRDLSKLKPISKKEFDTRSRFLTLFLLLGTLVLLSSPTLLLFLAGLMNGGVTQLAGSIALGCGITFVILNYFSHAPTAFDPIVGDDVLTMRQWVKDYPEIGRFVDDVRSLERGLSYIDFRMAEKWISGRGHPV